MGATPGFGFPFPDDTDLVIQAPQQFENLAVAVEGALETVRDDAADASNLTTGTVPLARIPSLPAGQVTSGTFAVGRIPSLPAGQITSGTFAVARIPSLSTAQITGGTFDPARIPALTFLGNVNSGSITSGFGNINIGGSTFTGNGAGISNLQAGNIAGTIPSLRLSGAYSGITGVGTLSSGAISGTFGNINIGGSTFTGNGSGLTDLNAASLTGTVANARISGAYSGITTLTTSSTIRSTVGQVRGASLRTDTSIFFNTTGFPRFETSGASVLLRGAGFLDMRFDGGFRLIDGNLINQSNLTFLNPSDTTGANPNVFMDVSTGRIQRRISSARYKRDIQDAEPMGSLLDVRPVTFRMKSGYSPGGVMYGVIAEELDELGLTHLVEYHEGVPESVHYPLLAVALIPHVRELAARVAALEEAA